MRPPEDRREPPQERRAEPRPPALVVLAAGASARLGSPKALARLAAGPRGTALEMLLDAGAALGSDVPPLVVTGRHDAEIRAALAGARGVEILFHPGWSAGRAGTVLAARDARAGRDLCLAPVDVPRVPRAVFAALAGAWRAAGAPATGWLAPAHAGRPGHPVVVGRELLSEWAPASADEPLRALRARARPLWTVAVESAAVLEDLDTADDLRDLSET